MDNQDVDQLFSDLMESSISMQDYKKMSDKGQLIKQGRWDCDFKFEKKHPNHPLASSIRSKRIDAADKIRELIVNNPAIITDQNIDILHKAVFDCCATVRLVIVQALGLLSRTDSLNILQRLHDIEVESNSVKKATQEAIRAIEGELKINEGHYIKTELVYC